MAKVLVVKDTGQVCDILPSNWFEGKEVAKPDGMFAVVNVSGMPPSDEFFLPFREEGTPLYYAATEHVSVTRDDFVAGANYGG